MPLVPAWRLDRTFDYAVPAGLAESVTQGSLVRVRFGGRRIRAVVLGLRAGAEAEELEAIDGVVVDVPITPPPIDDLFRWLARRYAVPLGKAFARAVPPRVRVALADPATVVPEPAAIVPTYERGSDLIAAIETGDRGSWCVESLWGEDRPAVISDLVSAALRAPSGGAIVCVPEVHYGSEVLAGLEDRFGDVARLDSDVSDGRRSAGMLRLVKGHRLGAGGRGAALAPMPDVRLIVVDEEHHRSYKEDRSPRYDARRVATERAQLQGAVCVFVSPTPTVETGHRARTGVNGFVAPGRAARRSARPLIEVTAKEPQRAIGTLLHRRIAEELRGGGRVGLLAPGRGYARAVWCAECRRSLRCPRCEAGMFFDRSAPPSERLHCPRCGTKQSAPDVCPHCGSTEFRWLGAGSERMAEQLAKAFPRVRVQHVDVTSIDSAAARASDADIYVTTWIGTKASVRPDVSLVGIVDAEALIRRPHFRAAEHAFQAFVHMAEWAGPASAGGRLILQSDEPNHYVLQALVRGDYGYFLERELEQRKDLRYPPFCELIVVRALGDAQEAAMSKVIETCRGAQARVLGPIRARATGGDALEVLIKTDSAQDVADRLRVILPETPAGARLTIDVDPR